MVRARPELGLIDSPSWMASLDTQSPSADAVVKEHVLVCVGPAETSRRLIRAAARMAAGLVCAWTAVYVERPDGPALADVDAERLDEHLRVVEALGGRVSRVAGDDVAETVLDYARRIGVTRIVLGKPTHPRIRDLVRGSLLDAVVRGSGDIDVHVIRGEPEAPARPTRVPPSAHEPPRKYVAASALVALTLAISEVLRRILHLPDLEMLFLLAVMVAAFRYGRGPSLLAAALGVACYDFFFVPPLYTFSVADRKYVLTFGMMFGVGWVASALASRLRVQEHRAIAREQRTLALYGLAKALASTEGTAPLAETAVAQVAEVLGAPVEVWLSEGGGRASLVAASAMPATRLAAARAAIEGVVLSKAPVPTRALAASPGTVVAQLSVAGSPFGALVVDVPSTLPHEQVAFFDVLARQIAVALGRARLSEEARALELRARTEEMRASLLSAVSHDLRTPLASITGAATTLRDEPKLSEATRTDLVDAIVDQAERLERLVANLLDMTRLEAGIVSPKKDWVPADEVVGAVLTRLEGRLARRTVDVRIDAHVPLLYVDPVLFEQVLVNLLENAEKHTPPSASVVVGVERRGETIVVEVRDDGPGIPEGAEERIFEKFERGASAASVGAGLGLAICRGIVHAHGGTIVAKNRREGGLSVEVTLPVVAGPPSLEPAEESAP
jgi:two-component system sensor histidine kinase KdpD